MKDSLPCEIITRKTIRTGKLLRRVAGKCIIEFTHPMPGVFEAVDPLHVRLITPIVGQQC